MYLLIISFFVQTYTARMGFLWDIRWDNNIWHPGRLRVGIEHVYRTRRFCKDPIAVVPGHIRIVY